MRIFISQANKRRLGKLAAVVMWIAVWQALSLIINEEVLLPSPVLVAERLLVLVRTAAFWRNIAASLLRVLIGLLTGTFLGTLFAVVSKRFLWIRGFLAPLLRLSRTVPVVSFIILAIVWFPRNVLPVFVSAVMVLPVIWQNMEEGISKIDVRYYEAAQVYCVPFARRFWMLYIPSVKPFFISALITASGFAWKAGIAAEVLYEPAVSIGRGLSEAKNYLNTGDLFAWTVVIVLVGWLMEKLICFLLQVKMSPKE